MADKDGASGIRIQIPKGSKKERTIISVNRNAVYFVEDRGTEESKQELRPLFTNTTTSIIKIQPKENGDLELLLRTTDGLEKSVLQKEAKPAESKLNEVIPPVDTTTVKTYTDDTKNGIPEFERVDSNKNIFVGEPVEEKQRVSRLKSLSTKFGLSQGSDGHRFQTRDDRPNTLSISSGTGLITASEEQELGKSPSLEISVEASEGKQDQRSRFRDRLPYVTSLSGKEEFDPKIGIWDEDVNAQNVFFLTNLQAKNLPTSWKNIKGISLNRLVQLVTSPVIESDESIKEFWSCVCTVYLSFTDTECLLNKLFERFKVPYSDDLNELELKDLIRIECRVIDFFVHAVNEIWKDFLNPPMLFEMLKEWVTATHEELEILSMAKEENLFGKLSREQVKPTLEGLKKIIGMKESKGSYVSLDEYGISADSVPEPKLPKNVNWRTTQLIVLDEEEVARQFTIADYHLYAECHPKHFLNASWTKEAEEHLARPPIRELIDRFNHFSSAVSTMILSGKSLKLRKLIVQKILKIAMQAEKLKNYNMLMAIVSGISNSAVHRLSFTFDELKKSEKEKLEHIRDLLNPAHNYRNIRTLFDDMSDGPCIPYFGMFMTDLIFINEGQPDYFEKGIIHFHKLKQSVKAIKTVLKFRDNPYNFKLVPQIQKLIDELPVWDDEKLYQESLSLEPRNAAKNQIS